MKKLLLILLVLTGMAVSSKAGHAQADGVVYVLIPEIYNGVVAIKTTCTVTNGFGDEYYGVLAYGCTLTSPTGTTSFNGNGGWETAESSAGIELPISTFGTWQGAGQYYVAMNEDCGEGCFDDTQGLSDFGVQECNDKCNFYGDGDNEFFSDATFELAESSTSVEVNVVAQSAPATVSLVAGESQTFNAQVAGIPPGGSTGVTWTISNLAGGTATANGNSYTYTAPGTTSTTLTAYLYLKACATAAPTACSTSTITLLNEELALAPPDPAQIFADGVSNSYLNAYVTNGPANFSLSWTPQPPAISVTGTQTATYTAPLASAVTWSAGSNTATVPITATLVNSNPAISAATTLTLVQPVTITNVAPASVTAGTTTTVTISGSGFGSSPSISFNSPSWQGVTFTATTITNTSIQGTLSVSANATNVSASQPITFTVEATGAGLTSSATSATGINILFISYTYTITLSATANSLTYGSTSLITPHIACKTATGGSCGTNPQTANFTLSGVGSISNGSGATSVTYTASTPVPTPQSATIAACTTLAPSTCVPLSLSIQATTLTLNPPSLPSPIASGKAQAFTSSIQNPGIATQLTWTLSTTGQGTLAYATTPIAGTLTSGTSSNTYTAPNPITGPASVNLTACISGTSLCATPVALQLAGFSIALTPNSSVPALSLGHSVSYTVTASALDGFNGTISLQVGGSPTGVTAVLSQPSVTTSGSSTVTLILTSAYAKTTFIGSSTIKVTGTSGTLVGSASMPLTTRPLQYKGDCGVP